MATPRATAATFKVVDAMNAPHGGRILRLRLQEGGAPTIRELRGGRLRAVSPDGEEQHLRVEGFPSFGGRPTDERLARTGRVDVHVTAEGEGAPVGLLWEVSLAT